MFKILHCVHNFFKLIILNKKAKRFFFIENKNLYQYLDPYIKSSNKKCVLISSEYLEISNKDILIVLNIAFFLELALIFLRARYLYSSTPDLENCIFKKSKISNCKYIYLQHSNISLSIGYNSNAFDHFDAIQAINTFQVNEIKIIRKHNKKKIKIIKSKYPFLNTLKQKEKKNYLNNINVLIAPTWNTNIFSEFIFSEIIKILSNKNIPFTIRPHYMTFKKKSDQLKILNQNVNIDTTPSLDISKYNYLITDWSGIFLEFIQIKKKKVFFLDTRKKILNKNYNKLFNEPIEEALRNEFGYIINKNKINIFNSYCNIIKENKPLEIRDNFDITKNQLDKYFF